MASITYTSGVTGDPKGVISTHSNFVAQLKSIPDMFGVSPQDRFISLLPAWHIFGRVVDHYMVISRGCPLYYTNKKNLSEDLKLVQPTIITSVPRVWEGIYNRIVSQVYRMHIWQRFFFWSGIRITETCQSLRQIWTNEDRIFHKPFILKRGFQKIYALLGMILLFIPRKILQLQFKPIIKALGGKLRVAISGGSSLPRHLDSFFAALNVPICEGYGLTESTSVVTHRYPKNSYSKKSMLVPGTVGAPTAECEIKILTKKEGRDVTRTGEPGIIYLRGPMIMQGYWKNEKATKAVLDDQGWFNTGDIGRMTAWGALSIVGRDKDTIVLSNGENVEPQPIEQELRKSHFIERVIIVGQDRKSIGALIVPIKENLIAWAQTQNLDTDNYKHLLLQRKVRDHYHKILNDTISYQNGFKEFERVNYFYLLEKEFTPGEELTPTLKLKRNTIMRKYEKEINEMYFLN